MIAQTIVVNSDILLFFIGTVITVTIGILAWAIKRLIDVGDLVARTDERLDDLERRMSTDEADIRDLSYHTFGRAPRRASDRPKTPPST